MICAICPLLAQYLVNLLLDLFDQVRSSQEFREEGFTQEETERNNRPNKIFWAFRRKHTKVYICKSITLALRINHRISQFLEPSINKIVYSDQMHNNGKVDLQTAKMKFRQS